MVISKEQFLEYYEQGFSDAQIGKLVGWSSSAIRDIRVSLNLPPVRMHIISDQEFLELYQRGLTDIEMASVSGASVSQIHRRRQKFQLPKNIATHPLDENFLELYNLGNNDSEISKITGISKNAVRNYRIKLELPAIGFHTIDKELLIKMYNEGRTDAEIAKATNKSIECVKEWRQRFRLLRANKYPNDYIYSDNEFQVILGSLLGDGSLVKTHINGGTILRITHCEKQKEYLEYKWNLLKGNALEIKHYTFHDERRKIPEYSSFSFYTKSSKSLNEVYYNWYRPTKTVYREDLFKLGPLGLAIWYMDDGYKCNPYGGAMLCTNNFSRSELQLIQEMFKTNFDINVTHKCQENLTYIPVAEFEKFKKIIEPYMIPSMMYKLGHSKTPLNRETPEEQDNPVLNP